MLLRPSPLRIPDYSKVRPRFHAKKKSILLNKGIGRAHSQLSLHQSSERNATDQPSYEPYRNNNTKIGSGVRYPSTKSERLLAPYSHYATYVVSHSTLESAPRPVMLPSQESQEQSSRDLVSPKKRREIELAWQESKRRIQSRYLGQPHKGIFIPTYEDYC